MRASLAAAPKGLTVREGPVEVLRELGCRLVEHFVLVGDDGRHTSGNNRRGDAAIEVAVPTRPGLASVEKDQADTALAKDLARIAKTDILNATLGVLENQIAGVFIVKSLDILLIRLHPLPGHLAVWLAEHAVADEMDNVELAHGDPAVQAVRGRLPQHLDDGETSLLQRLETAPDDALLLFCREMAGADWLRDSHQNAQGSGFWLQPLRGDRGDDIADEAQVFGSQKRTPVGVIGEFPRLIRQPRDGGGENDIEVARTLAR